MFGKWKVRVCLKNRSLKYYWYAIDCSFKYRILQGRIVRASHVGSIFEGHDLFVPSLDSSLVKVSLQHIPSFHIRYFFRQLFHRLNFLILKMISVTISLPILLHFICKIQPQEIEKFINCSVLTDSITFIMQCHWVYLELVDCLYSVIVPNYVSNEVWITWNVLILCLLIHLIR